MKRALLIGSSWHKRDVEPDLALMAEVLGEEGFVCVPAPRPATRANILGALCQLAKDTQPGDTVVVYYTGHGGLGRFASEIAGLRQPGRIWRYLVPEDAAHSREAKRFAGVLDAELGHIVGREIASKTNNVTVILECCYAGGMVAPEGVRFRHDARPRGFVDIANFETFPDDLCKAQPWSAGVLGLADVWIDSQAPVVVAATTEARKAFATGGNASTSDFTTALAAVLRRYRGRRVTWGRVIDQVRREVYFCGQQTAQQPHVIGPRGRAVFGTSTSDVSRNFDVLVGRQGELHLMAGTLHGLHEGDELELLKPVDDHALAQVRIQGIERGHARLQVVAPLLTPSWSEGDTLVAILRTSAQPMTVAFTGADSPTTLELRRALLASPWLQVGTPHQEAAYRVECDSGRLRVEGQGLARQWTPLEPREDLGDDYQSPVPWVVTDLEALARARGFVAACEGLPPPPQTMTFTLMADGKPVESGGQVSLRSKIRLRMNYVGRYERSSMFVHVVNIGLDGRAHLVTKRGGLALVLQEGGRDIVQERKLSWPAEVPLVPTLESLYILISSVPIDLDALSRVDPDLERASRARGAGFLNRLLEPIDLHVLRIEFELSPDSPRL